jgi:nucleotide-binding universal stress UspA family protein
MFSTIVVGTDGSETATKAVQQAAELAAKINARVEIVTAFSRDARTDRMAKDRAGAPDDVKHCTEPISYAEEHLNKARETVASAGVDAIEVHSVDGDPAEAIISVAEKVDADLIVVGNKGMTGGKRFLLGSVPNKVSHHAPCAVMIARTT